MFIRPFDLADEDAVVDLWQRCGLTRSWNDPHKDIRRKLKVNPELFLVGLIEGRLVGSVMAGYEGHRGWIQYLAVDPEERRRGLGRALMAEAERRLRELGCPKINLQVRGSNQEVIAFYESLGFAVEDILNLGKRLEHDEPDKQDDGVSIGLAALDSADARMLIAQLDEELDRLYPAVTIHGLHPSDYEPGRLLFLIARRQGEPIACGGLRFLEAGVAEIKRMFVVPAFRRQGHAGRVLAALEALAKEHRCRIVRLETGNRDSGPILLYRKAGYREIPPYGEYIGNPLSVCFEKSFE